jgi:hypothetical protein
LKLKLKLRNSGVGKITKRRLEIELTLQDIKNELPYEDSKVKMKVRAK